MSKEIKKPYSKVKVESAPVVKHGGNKAIHDGVETAGEPKKVEAAEVKY